MSNDLTERELALVLRAVRKLMVTAERGGQEEKADILRSAEKKINEPL